MKNTESKSSKKASAEVPSGQLKKVWRDLSLGDWKAALDHYGLGGKWSIKGDGLHGCCPFPGHHDESPSCWIKPSRGFVKCFGCGQYESNPVKFLATCSGQSWASVLNSLRKNFSLKSLPRRIGLELQEFENYQAVKSELALVMSEALCAAAEEYKKTGKFSEKSSYAASCIKYLEEREVPLELSILRNLPIGILPPVSLLKASLGEKFEAALSYVKDWARATYVGALVFYYHASPTELSGFRLRADFLRKGGDKDIVKVSDKYFDKLGYFGLGNYLGKIGVRPKGGLSEAVIVEGEFDALAIISSNLKDGRLYDTTLAIGGASDPHLDELKEFGIDRCLLVTDSEEHSGDKIAQLLLSNNDLPMMVFSWPEEIQAKDPDEAIKEHGWEAWNYHVLALEPGKGSDAIRRKNFLFPHRWVSNRFRAALKHVDQDDIAAKKKLIGAMGSCLRDPDEQRLFANEAHSLTQVPVGTIFELMVGSEETELGYVHRIIQALKACYHFIGVDARPSAGVRIHAWHRERREVRVWTVTRASELFGQLGVDLGSMIAWARKVVGVPSWVTQKRVGKAWVETTLLEQNALQKRYMEMAIEEILRSLPSMDRLQELKAGCHYIDLPSPDGQTTSKGWVIVNGNSVYVGRYTDDDSIAWNLMDGPRIGNYFFNIVRSPWSTELSSVSDLYDGLDYRLQDAYDFIVTALNLGWKLKNQREDCEYLAAAMLLNTVSSALPRQLYTILNGSRGSGKSKLLGLIAGSLPEVRILEAAFSMDSYTVAGFRKEMNGCALGACLDEFEDAGDTNHSRHVREILHDVRGLTSNRECRILRGNMDSSEATVYTLKCQLWVAAIQYLRDEADVSRFIQIHTELEEGMASPTGTLMETFGEEAIRRHRRTLTLGLFRSVPALLMNIESLRSAYSKPEVMNALAVKCGVEVPSRFLDGVIIPAAMVQLAGHNPHDFIVRFTMAKASYLSRIVKSTHKNTLLGHILSARIEYSRPGSEARYTTIRTMLSDASDRINLGGTNCGVQYIEFDGKKGLRRWMVVVWPDAIHGVLKSVPLYRNETAARLKQLADSDKAHTVDGRSIRHVPGGIKQLLKPGIGPADYTVYDLSVMLNAWDSGAA